MRLHVLGGGDAFGSGGRFNTCFHVSAGRTDFLLDCGASSLIAMRRFGLEPNAVETVLISHLHGDHFGGLPFLLLDAHFVSQRRRPLTIAGPPTLTSRLHALREARFPGSADIKLRFPLDLVELEPEKSVAVNGIQVMPLPVRHPSEAPSFALRCEIDGKTLCYSGDTEWVEALVRAAQNADLFIAESYTFERSIPFHTRWLTLRDHLPEINAKREVPQVTLPTGETVPALGQGTWQMAEVARHRGTEIKALRLGIELGLTLIDTAEMYGEGAAEELVSEAIEGHRDEVFLVSKVYPHNASRRGVAQACDRSLKRLKTDRLDLYLLHWRGSIPLQETVAGFEALRQAGKIRHWGVSNFDTSDLHELVRVQGGTSCATNQVLYNVTRRGPEFDLMPWMANHRMPLTAYSPVEQGRLPRSGPLQTVASKHGVSPYQIALAWLLQKPGVMAIPKAGRPEHVRDNHGALSIELDGEDLQEIDAAFPPPTRRSPLEMI